MNIKIGLACIIIKDNKILLGHRSANRTDTGGIHEPDTWTLPGGKQEFDETIQECAVRETKEECNLDVSDIKVLTTCDDIAPDKHFVTITTMANHHSGNPVVMEPTKEDEWKWFDIDNLPDNLYPPTINSLNYYKENIYERNI